MKKLLFTVAFLISIPVIGTAQINMYPDTVYTATLGAGENLHLYTLELENNQLVSGQLMQFDIDVD